VDDVLAHRSEAAYEDALQLEEAVYQREVDAYESHHHPSYHLARDPDLSLHDAHDA
jgi:hypothetical protein